MASASNSYDIIIVGGGPVGLTLAASLIRFGSGLKIAVCDRRPFTVPEDARASALAAGVTRVFEGLGLWENMRAAASPIARMEITDSGQGDLARPLFLQFEGDVAPNTPYAHMVPNKVTIATLLEAIAGKVDLLVPGEITGLETDGALARLKIAGGEDLSAPLIVAADGARSALRDMAGIGVVGHDYDQMGIVTTISHALAHHNTAWEHFRPAGPFASLPLPGQRSSLVWTEKSEDALRYKDMSPEELAPVIEAAMGSVLGTVAVDDVVQAFPLRLQIARSFVGKRLALIGDAAHVVHPIAGQGLNLGLKDVAALAEVIIEAQRLGQDMGGADILERYERWRRFDTALMALATDGLNSLFSNDVAPVRAVRDLGLGLVDRLPFLKTGLIRHAAGLSDGPKLLRGQPI